MAITLAVAMIVCVAFRAALVRILQAPLRDVGSQIGTLKALGITDSIVISFHLAFYAGIVLSFRCCCISWQNLFCLRSPPWRNAFYFQRLASASRFSFSA